MVVSDEIWSDIILAGHQAHSHAVASARTPAAAPWPSTPPARRSTWRVLWAATTLFTTPCLRDRVEKEASLSHYNSMNVLSMHALIGAYRPEGYEWVDELRQVLTANVDFACDFIARAL